MTRAGVPWPASRTLVSVNLAFGGHNACVAVTPGPAGAIAAARPRERDDVVVTGCGAVTPRPVDAAALAACLGPFMQAQTGTLVAGPGLDLRTLDRRLDTRGLDTASAAAIAAALLSFRHAGLPLPRAGRGGEIGLYTHVLHAPLWAEQEHLRAVLASNYHVDHLTAFPYVVANAVNGVVARALGLTGHNAAFCLGEGAGVTGLALACCAVGAGRAPALLSLAVDEGAPGTAPGEEGRGDAAAGILLESASHARARRAAVLASVRAVTLAGGLCRTGRERVERLAGLVHAALSQAGAGPAEVEVVCHDADRQMEKDALRQVDPQLDARAVTVDGMLGRAVACGVTLSLAAVLGARRVEGVGERKYILVCMGSPSGYDAVVVLSRDPSA